MRLAVDNVDASSLSLSLNGAIALGAPLVSATTAFAQLQETLNRVWGIDLPGDNVVGSWLRRRVFSLDILTVIGFLLVTALVVSTLLAAVLTQEGWLCRRQRVRDAGGAGRGVRVPLPGPYLTKFHRGRARCWAVRSPRCCSRPASGCWAPISPRRRPTMPTVVPARSCCCCCGCVYYSAFIVLLGAGASRALADWRGWKLARRRG